MRRGCLPERMARWGCQNPSRVRRGLSARGGSSGGDENVLDSGARSSKNSKDHENPVSPCGDGVTHIGRWKLEAHLRGAGLDLGGVE